MWWLVGSVGSALLGAGALAACGKSRNTVHKPKSGSKSAKGTKSTKSGKSGKSARDAKSASRKSASKSGRSARSSRTARSGKSAKGGSTKTAKGAGSSTKTAKDAKSKSGSVSRSKKSASKTSKTATASARSSKGKKMDAALSSARDKTANGGVKPTSKELMDKVGGAPPSTVDVNLQPSELHWKPTGGMQKVHVANNTKERRAIKVKCSDNLLYRVNPVYTFIEPGESVKIDVLRQNGSAKMDKMVLLTSKASGEDPKGCFQPGQQNEMLVLPLLVNAE